jgi:hypothetical protein
MFFLLDMHEFRPSLFPARDISRCAGVRVYLCFLPATRPVDLTSTARPLKSFAIFNLFSFVSPNLALIAFQTTARPQNGPRRRTIRKEMPRRIHVRARMGAQFYL